MPALSGSLSYARFFVPEKLPRGFFDRSLEKIRHRAMRPLEASDPAPERAGWCVMGDPLDLSLPRERIFLDGWVNLGLRIDRWAIPGPLFKSKLREAEAKYLEKKGRERLGRRERAELKEVVTGELRKKLVPTTRALDLTWSVEDGLVRFFSHSEKPTGIMLELFKATFGIELVPESPFTLGERLSQSGWGLDEDALAAWDELEPTVIARPSR